MKTKSNSSIEVAKRAGVSQATVSYVLNDRRDKSITPLTRQRVLDAVQELNYRPNRLANALLRGKTSTVGLIGQWIGSEFHARIMQGVREVLDDSGYHTFVSWGKSDPREQAQEVEILQQHRVEGLIYISGERQREQVETWLRGVVQKEELSCVIVDDRSHSDLVDCVVSNDRDGARIAVEHLIGLGHKRIAFSSNFWDGSTYDDRLDGYRAGLTQAGIAFDPDLYFPVPEHPRRMAIELHRLLRRSNPPTAILFSSDIPAKIARDAADDTGISIPGDVALVGYSNQHYALSGDLTSVSQNSVEMGRRAARMLLDRLKNADLAPRVEMVPTELIVRSSTVQGPRASRFDWPDESEL